MTARVELYDDAAREAIDRKAKRRWVQFGVFLGVLCAAALALFILRNQLLTIALSILGGGALIFWWDAQARQDIRHAKKVRNTPLGLHHEVALTVVQIEPEVSLRDGLEYRRVVCSDDEEEERYLYWDARIPLRDLEPGKRALVEHVGNDILSYQILA